MDHLPLPRSLPDFAETKKASFDSAIVASHRPLWCQDGADVVIGRDSEAVHHLLLVCYSQIRLAEPRPWR